VSEVDDKGLGPVPGRRRTLKWLGRIFVSLWGVGFVGVVLSYLKIPTTRRQRSGSDRTLSAGSLDALPVGGGQIVRHGAQPVIVIRPRADQVVALSGVCTHLRCVLRWDPKRTAVVCPCHVGVFDLNGNVISGPPNQPLKSFQAEVRGGEIFVHL
jgi:cytochrome b6-f complex iron-sulfur subunit